MTTAILAERKNDMFIKVTVIQEDNGIMRDNYSEEKFIDKDYIVTMTNKTVRDKQSNEYKDICIITLSTGESLKVLGKADPNHIKYGIGN